MLEERERALARGARIYAGWWVTGRPMTQTIVAPDPECRGGCLYAGGIGISGIVPSAIGYQRSRTSTPLTTSPKRWLSSRYSATYRLAVSSSKSMTGHLLKCRAISVNNRQVTLHGILPPTINLDDQTAMRPGLYSHQARKLQVEYALSTLWLWGHNACLVFVVQRIPATPVRNCGLGCIAQCGDNTDWRVSSIPPMNGFAAAQASPTATWQPRMRQLP